MGGSTRNLIKPKPLHLMLNVMKPGKKHSGNLLKDDGLENVNDPSLFCSKQGSGLKPIAEGTSGNSYP
jgi:hypothetical protein